MDTAIPAWNYNEAELLETTRILGVKRTLYKLPDVMQIHGIESSVYFYHYEPLASEKFNKKQPVFISYPILGGKMKITNGKSKFVDPASHSGAWFAATVLQMNAILVATDNKLMFQPTYKPEDVCLELKNIIYNHIQIHDFIINSIRFHYLDCSRFHHFGISLGAITATVVAGITQRYSTLTAVMSGASIADIMAHSQEKSVKEFFQQAMLNLGKTADELHTWLTQALQEIDTASVASTIDKHKVFLVLAMFDDTVPNNVLKSKEPKTGFKLKELMGNPKTDLYPTDHYIMIGMIPFWLPRMVKHILDNN
jgi:hypothetical protein